MGQPSSLLLVYVCTWLYPFKMEPTCTIQIQLLNAPCLREVLVQAYIKYQRSLNHTLIGTLVTLRDRWLSRRFVNAPKSPDAQPNLIQITGENSQAEKSHKNSLCLTQSLVVLASVRAASTILSQNFSPLVLVGTWKHGDPGQKGKGTLKS